MQSSAGAIWLKLSEVTGQPTTDPKLIREKLIEQLTAPVLWHPTMTMLKSMGIVRIIEVGPKKVLLGLAKPVFGTDNAVSLDTHDDLGSWKDTVAAVSTAN